jgi:hypothetical protein
MAPDLQWWGWLLCGAVGLVIGALVSDLRHPDAPMPRVLVGFVFILAALVGFAQGIVGFIKWAWAG